MDDLTVIFDFLTAVEAQDWQTVSSLLAEDFIHTGGRREAVGKEAFVQTLRGLTAVFAPLNIRLDHLRGAHGNYVADARITGTHSGVFTEPGYPPFPPTGAPVVITDERFGARLRDGRIVELSVPIRTIDLIDQLGVYFLSQRGASQRAAD